MLEKVLLVNDFSYGGGAEKIFQATGDYLKDEYEVTKFSGAETATRPENFISFIYSKKYKAEFLKILVSIEPKIIHIHNYYHLLSPSILDAIRTYRRQGKTVSVVMTAHDFHLICPNSGYYYFNLFSKDNITRFTSPPSILQRILLRYDHRSSLHSWLKKFQWIYSYSFRRFQNEIDVIISPSDFLVHHFKLKFKDRFRFLTVRNPTSTNISLNGVRNNAKSQLRLAFVGRFSFEKGLFEFISSLVRIEDDLHFDLYGDGPNKAELANFIKLNRLEDKVNIKGWLNSNDLYEKLVEYDALVLPTLCYENAPLSIVEAALLNLRILTCDYGGMKEIANICRGEYLFDPYNANSIQEAIKKCHDDVINGRIIEGRNMSGIKDIFSEANYRENLKEIYRNCLKR